MKEILASVESVSRIMQEIATASRTQSDDIAQLHESIDRIDGDTQQNAARVEETAAVAQSLRTQVESLLDAVGMFTLSSDVARPSVAAAPPVGAQSSQLSNDELRSAA
jgi:methyl-accepting chemotaxis protein